LGERLWNQAIERWKNPTSGKRRELSLILPLVREKELCGVASDWSAKGTTPLVATKGRLPGL
jgi:hypothetical protein